MPLEGREPCGAARACRRAGTAHQVLSRGAPRTNLVTTAGRAKFLISFQLREGTCWRYSISKERPVRIPTWSFVRFFGRCASKLQNGDFARPAGAKTGMAVAEFLLTAQSLKFWPYLERAGRAPPGSRDRSVSAYERRLIQVYKMGAAAGNSQPASSRSSSPVGGPDVGLPPRASPRPGPG